VDVDGDVDGREYLVKWKLLGYEQCRCEHVCDEERTAPLRREVGQHRGGGRASKCGA
jgi:hypothetical protein